MSIDQRNIMSSLRMMPDTELRRYAEMHKKDPYIFPLAFQESQDRQQMRAGQQAQMAGQEPPKVVDQALASMGQRLPMPQQAMPAPMPQQAMPAPRLPEDSGIGALPAPNMQRMADGGIVGYADKGAVTDGSKVTVEEQLARDSEVLQILQAELAKAEKPSDIASLQREIQRVQYRINKGNPYARVPSLGQKITAALPIGAAEAAPAPQPPQMTQGEGERPLTGNEQVLGLGETALRYGTGLADVVGSGASALYGGVTGKGDPQKLFNKSLGSWTYDPRSEGGQRISESTERALRDMKIPPYVPAIGPAGQSARAAGLKALAEKDAGKSAATRLTASPEATGVSKLPTYANQEGALLAKQMQDRNATETSARAAVGGERAAAAEAEAIAASKRAQGVAYGASSATGTPGGIADVAANQKPMRQAEEQHEGATPLTKKEEDKIKDKVREEVPASQRKGWSGEDILMFGLQMMAGKSQYAMQNIGEAGIATLANRQAQLKAETERGKTASDIKEAGQRGKLYEAQATSLESGEKLDAAAKAKAADTAVKRLEIWIKNPENRFASNAQQRQMYNTFYAEALAGSTITQEAAAPDSTGWGKAVQH